MIRRRTLTSAAVASLLAPSISRGAAADDEVLLEIPVTKRWLRQVIVGAIRHCVE